MIPAMIRAMMRARESQFDVRSRDCSETIFDVVSSPIIGYLVSRCANISEANYFDILKNLNFSVEFVASEV